MIEVNIFDLVGVDFAENKDVARDVREKTLMPALVRGEDVVLDFSGISDATQSFIHALISDAIRKLGPEVLERISFKNCGKDVREVIEIVVGYMQGGDES